MKSYFFALYEEKNHSGSVNYEINITPTGNNAALMSKKTYDNEEAYRSDVKEDFSFNTKDGSKLREVATLSDERARYYGWTGE